MEWTLVTGGARRLGENICLHLACESSAILVHYNKSEKEALQVAKECQKRGAAAAVIQGDFSNMETTLEFIERCKSLFPDVKNLINNVGTYLIKSGLKTSEEEWASLFQTNLHVPFALIKGFLSSLSKYQGSVINLGVVGLNGMRAEINRTGYMSAKMSLYMLTKSFAKELAPFGINVNMVSPGYLENSIDLPQSLSQLPMHRPATLDEVSCLIGFLIDKKNKYITGQNIEVGGGVNL